MTNLIIGSSTRVRQQNGVRATELQSAKGTKSAGSGFGRLARSSLLTGGEKERGQDTLPYTEPAEAVKVL